MIKQNTGSFKWYFYFALVFFAHSLNSFFYLIAKCLKSDEIVGGDGIICSQHLPFIQTVITVCTITALFSIARSGLGDKLYDKIHQKLNSSYEEKIGEKYSIYQLTLKTEKESLFRKYKDISHRATFVFLSICVSSTALTCLIVLFITFTESWEQSHKWSAFIRIWSWILLDPLFFLIGGYILIMTKPFWWLKNEKKEFEKELNSTPQIKRTDPCMPLYALQEFKSIYRKKSSPSLVTIYPQKSSYMPIYLGFILAIGISFLKRDGD